jgi:predicted Zn-dependent protease
VNAVAIAARGVARFPKEAGLYALYTQFVREEADTVLQRGLAQFPNSAELLALNAKELRSQGKVAESLESMKSAIAADSTLVGEGQLMIAQAQIDLGRPDSALVALRAAVARGEDSTRVAQFAFARGNALYRAANGTKASADYALALRFLAFADSVRSSPQTRFLVGAAALGVAQRALTEATLDKVRANSCSLARLGAEMIPLARTEIEAGQEVMPDAARQSLDYLTQIEPYAGKQLTAYCDGA